MTRLWQSSMLIVVLSVILPLSARAETLFLVQPHGGISVYDAQVDAATFSKSTVAKQFSASGITFNITYDDVNEGFTDPLAGAALQARLEDVLAYVASMIQFNNRSLDVQVSASEFDGTGALATAGTFYPGTPGIHRGSTLDRLETGVKPFPGFPEISITVDLGFTWNVSEALPGPDEADFFSVLLHEVTHGLGFASVIESDGSSALGSDNYTTYDSLLFDAALNRLLLTDSIPPFFQGDSTSLTGGALEFDGPESFTRYDTGDRVPVFSPNPIQPGSSLSHWDLGRLVGGAVMTHSITLGTTQREYAPADLGALIDLGYDNIGATDGGAPVVGCARSTRQSGRPLNSGSALVLGLTVAVLVSYQRRGREVF
jgi:hypothetical protein